MVRLRRIPVFRAANLLTLTMGIPYGILLFIFMIVFSPWSATTTGGGTATTTFLGQQAVTSALLAWAVAMLSIWLFVAIACGLYNLIAGRFGGIELEFTTIPPSS